jgi:hypothetical protein
LDEPAGGLAGWLVGEWGLGFIVGLGAGGEDRQVCKARVWQSDGGALFDTARYASRPAGCWTLAKPHSIAFKFWPKRAGRSR